MRVNTLETDVEVSDDGSLKLLSPLPSWLRPGRNHVLLVMADRGSGRSATDVREAGTSIEKTENVCGGDACVAGTRVPVWTLEQHRRLGLSEEEMLEAYPSLNRADLEAAWAYVKVHSAEIEKAIRDNEEA